MNVICAPFHLTKPRPWLLKLSITITVHKHTHTKKKKSATASTSLQRMGKDNRSSLRTAVIRLLGESRATKDCSTEKPCPQHNQQSKRPARCPWVDCIFEPIRLFGLIIRPTQPTDHCDWSRPRSAGKKDEQELLRSVIAEEKEKERISTLYLFLFLFTQHPRRCERNSVIGYS